MKKTSIFLLIILYACGSSDNTKKDAAKNETSGSSAANTATNENGNEVTLSPSNEPKGAKDRDTILWVGKPARWKKSQGVTFDGSYDPENGYFMPCGQQKTFKVAGSNIEYDNVANCDSSLTSSVRLMYYDMRTDSIGHVLPHQLQLSSTGTIDSNHVKFIGTDKVIRLSPNDKQRVITAYNRHNMLIREKVRLVSPPPR